ncbi:MAG TPA: CHAP domain-containing protein [Candidatus Saccharimonadia bacterium]|nr:CHAP domain-containing protein [Candidatus Saccharimonadia bacterium]
MQQASLVFYKFQFLFAGIFAIAFIMFISAVVTSVGSHSILDTKTNRTAAAIGVAAPEGSDPLTAGVYGLINGTEHTFLKLGATLYAACKSTTSAGTTAGKTIAHGSIAAVQGVWHGVAFVNHHAATAALFAVRAPVELVRPLTSGNAVHSILQPSDDKLVPVINGETSTAVLARLSARQQETINSLLVAQAAANRELGGSVVAGDPNHGGYPIKWDTPARQDGQIDSWGMYNRECVSYTAWKVYQTYGNMPYWGGVGNANQWVRDAKRAGIATSSTPKVHSVAISMRGYYGHAMWVEKVSGNMIYVSQYNYDLHGHYSEMWIASGGLTYIYFN